MTLAFFTGSPATGCVAVQLMDCEEDLERRSMALKHLPPTYRRDWCQWLKLSSVQAGVTHDHTARQGSPEPLLLFQSHALLSKLCIRKPGQCQNDWQFHHDWRQEHYKRRGRSILLLQTHAWVSGGKRLKHSFVISQSSHWKLEGMKMWHAEDTAARNTVGGQVVTFSNCPVWGTAFLLKVLSSGDLMHRLSLEGFLARAQTRRHVISASFFMGLCNHKTNHRRIQQF